MLLEKWKKKKFSCFATITDATDATKEMDKKNFFLFFATVTDATKILSKLSKNTKLANSAKCKNENKVEVLEKFYISKRGT